MAIEAPFSKFRKSNLKIYIVACLAFGAWLAYDGYISEKFIAKHSDEQGVADASLNFNRKAPIALVALVGFFAACHVVVSKRKLVADEKELIISANERIAYDSIEKIDRTYFESKGYFVVTYKDSSGKETDLRISHKKYDNLKAIVDHLVAKIS